MPRIVRLKAHRMERRSKPGLGSCWIRPNTSCESWYLSQRNKGRKENRNHRGCRRVNKRGSSLGQAFAGERGQAGETAGERVSLGYFRAFKWRIGRAARRTEGEDA